ncbi:hypothetical protein MRX96_011839 [Rhipicephalus microplus]
MGPRHVVVGTEKRAPLVANPDERPPLLVDAPPPPSCTFRREALSGGRCKVALRVLGDAPECAGNRASDVAV